MYTNFAYIYDKLMYDVDYSKWADYVEKIFAKYKKKPSLVLDLGCGTGNFSIEMAKRGYDMIGVDISEDMLSCAKDKSLEASVDILYLNQDMCDFELYGTVDAIVCLMDSVNYVTDKRNLKKVFKLVKNYLNPEGLFIFDINTAYKFGKVLSNNFFYDIGEDVTYIWDNKFDKRRHLCEFELTFFIKDGDEKYFRHDENHIERAYTHDEIKEIIEEAQLNLLNVYDELKFSPPREDSERVFYICKK